MVMSILDSTEFFAGNGDGKWFQIHPSARLTRPSEKQPKHDSLLVLNEPFRFFCKWLGV